MSNYIGTGAAFENVSNQLILLVPHALHPGLQFAAIAGVARVVALRERRRYWQLAHLDDHLFELAAEQLDGRLVVSVTGAAAAECGG